MAADSADNDVINGDKERWDEYDDDYDSSGNVIIGGTRYHSLSQLLTRLELLFFTRPLTYSSLNYDRMRQ